MGWRAPPSREHNEGVVDADPEQEEGGGKVQRDEFHLRVRDEDLDDDCCDGDIDDMDHDDDESDPQVAGESESGEDGEHRGEEAEETDQWLRTNLEG